MCHHLKRIYSYWGQIRFPYHFLFASILKDIAYISLLIRWLTHFFINWPSRKEATSYIYIFFFSKATLMWFWLLNYQENANDSSDKKNNSLPAKKNLLCNVQKLLIAVLRYYRWKCDITYKFFGRVPKQENEVVKK